MQRDYSNGDMVVITERNSNSRGMVGKVEITKGWQTVGVTNGCLNIRCDPEGVRKLTSNDRVILP